MALFNVTSNKVGLPMNAVTISTLAVSYCDPQTIAPIDNIAYHNGGSRDLQLGDILFSDIGLTILYNTGSHRVYNTLDDPLGFIELTPASVYRVPVCVGDIVDEKFKISINDTTAGYFVNKIAAGTGISFTLGSPGGTEIISINSTIVPSGTGTVTNIASGSGMNFSAITTTGTITLGLPSTVNASSVNSLSANSHSHEWYASMFDLSNVLETTLVGKAGKFLTVNTAETGFIYGDGFVPYTGAITNVDLNNKQLTNISYLGIARSSVLSSGTDIGSYLSYTTSHTSTAGFDAFKINQTGTTGSGEKNLINLQVSGTSKFRVDTLGNFHNMVGTRSNNINDTTYFDDTIYLKNGGLITNESASGSVVIAANGITTISTINVDNDSILLTAASTNNGPAWSTSDTKYGVVVGRMWANITDIDVLTATSVQMYFNETVNHSSHGANSTHYTLRLNPTIINAGLKHYAIHSATGDVVFGNSIVTTPDTTVAQINAASIRTLITREYGDAYYLGIGSNTYHTTWAWFNGTGSGPTATISGTAAPIAVGAIPSASATVSGVMTTGTQTIAGLKTFSSSVTSPDFIGTSDRTLKDNIVLLPPTKINSTYKSFNFKGDTQLRVGVIAQELELYHPEFVRTNKDGLKAVSYNDLHSAEIAYLKSKLEELEWLLNNK